MGAMTPPRQSLYASRLMAAAEKMDGEAPACGRPSRSQGCTLRWQLEMRLSQAQPPRRDRVERTQPAEGVGPIVEGLLSQLHPLQNWPRRGVLARVARLWPQPILTPCRAGPPSMRPARPRATRAGVAAIFLRRYVPRFPPPLPSPPSRPGRPARLLPPSDLPQFGRWVWSTRARRSRVGGAWEAGRRPRPHPPPPRRRWTGPPPHRPLHPLRLRRRRQSPLRPPFLLHDEERRVERDGAWPRPPETVPRCGG